MKKTSLSIVWSVALLFLNQAAAAPSNPKLPMVDGESIVATVNEDPITLREFNEAIAGTHSRVSEGNKAGRIDFTTIMDRLVNTRLIGLEARSMGFADLPEMKNMVTKESKQAMMEQLLEAEVKDMVADAADVERIYKESVKEWQITSMEFEKEEDAKKIQTELQSNADFKTVLAKAVKAGIAKGKEQGDHIKNKDLTAPIAKLVAKMEIGAVSPMVVLEKQKFIIFKLDGVRYPEKEDQEAKKAAQTQALNEKKLQRVQDYFQELKKKYVTLNSELLEAVDFESKTPGFEKLLEDKRVIAQIKGDDDYTVGDLAKALKAKFYHGIEKPIEDKRVNSKKHDIVEDALQQKVFFLEAAGKGMDKTRKFSDRIKAYENSLLFGMFIDKVIVPEITLNQAELKSYYDANLGSYTGPQMLRIKSLSFNNKENTRKTFDKLVKGTDFTWLSAHAEGLLDKDPKAFQFDGQLLTLSSLPQDVQKLVADAKSGNYRLYENDKGGHQVLYITQVVSPSPQSFESVQQKIKEAVFKEKVKKAIEDWADKLKEHYPVVIYGSDLKH